MWGQIRSWVQAVLRRGRMESNMDAELRFHVEHRAEDLLRSGISRQEALRLARIEFGGIEQAKEECRHSRGLGFLDMLQQDVRYGTRTLLKAPAFTATAVLTLALGIGANTAIFSLINTVLLRPLPYKDAERLVTVWSYNRGIGDTTDLVSPLDFADWRAQNHVFENMGASTDVQYTLTGAGEPALLIAYEFSADYFRVLGVPPLLGRTFLPEEEQPGKNHVTVLSYSFWQNRVGRNPAIVGKTITLDGAPYTVIGVMPPDFKYPPSTELWTPLTIGPEIANDRSYRYLRVMARLKKGVTLQQAQREMNAIAGQLAVTYAKTNKDDDAANVIGLRQNISGNVRAALLVLLWAVAFVLLIACANVANLLLARSASRQKEVAVRAALGASKSRLVRQFFTESMLLGLISGALGLLLASLCGNAMVTMFPSTIFNLNLPHIEHIAVDGMVLGFALAISVLTGATFGLLPALQASRNVSACMKEAGRGLTGGTRAARLRSALIVAEVALSLLLLTAAGLTLRSFVHLLTSDLGFNPRHVLTIRILPPRYKYKTAAQQIAFSDAVLSRIRAIPGVQAAGTVTFLPLSGWSGRRTLALEGRASSTKDRIPAMWSSVTPDYFRAMQIPLLRGASFTDADTHSSATVAVVSKSLARQLSPNEDVIGRRIEMDGVKGGAEIVGVVSDVHHLGLTSEATSEIYLPFAQLPEPIMCFAIRTERDPHTAITPVQQAVWSVDKDQAVAFGMTMEELAADSLAPQRGIMLLLATFGAMALLMAGVGLYGVISNFVAQRTNEIGIRMSLGARPADVLRLVVGHGLALVAIGLSIGAAAALALMRFVSSLLYGIGPTDPATLAAAAVLLGIVAVTASYLPARRAMRVDPIVALRYE